MPYTYRDLIRIYSDGVAKGRNDSDLDRRTARVLALVLNTASNDYAADRPYPPDAQTREDVLARLSQTLWNGNVRTFIEAVSPSGATTFDAAVPLAFTILRNL